MKFRPGLVPATLVRRYQRFFAAVRFADGREDVAHCTNTGRMTGCAEPGSPVLVAPAPAAARRKLRWTLRLVRVGRAWVSVDTLLANAVVEEAVAGGAIPELAGYDQRAREVRYGATGHSRIDLLLRDSGGRRPDCYVEVKNVTLREGRAALFPDAVTARGKKHLEELAAVARAGGRAVLLPFVARSDCAEFAAARAVDPAWADALVAAHAAGVEVLPYRARISGASIELGDRLPWRRTESRG